MIRDILTRQVADAITAAQAAGDLPQFDVPEISLMRPRPELGDYACSVAMQLARIARLPPAQIAQRIARHVVSDIATIEVASAYVNFRLKPDFLGQQVNAVLQAGGRWGDIDLGRGAAAQVEHGSANPTGYATIGTGRNVVTGDTLANALDAAGYTVHREWYVNDAGNQIRAFGASLFSHYAQALGHDIPLPDKGYAGEDAVEVGRALAAAEGDRFLGMERDEATRELGRMGIDLVMARIRLTMSRLGIHFDNFFSERSLYTSGRAERALTELRARGLLIEHDGALWFSEDGSPIRAGQGKRKTSDEYAESEDVPETKGKPAPIQAVVIRSAAVVANPDERATYFASDIPYALNKVVERGFNPAVYVWGEDHQADVPRVYAAARALGLPEGSIRLIIYRFITLMRGGVEVRMGKRKGNAILADDVVDEVGVDAFRYVMLSRSVDTKFTFDLDLVKEQKNDNPVYYVQYGHARIASILSKAKEELGVDLDAAYASDYPLPGEPAELDLIRRTLELPEIIELVATKLEPHHLTAYAQSLAASFSKFYETCSVLGRKDSRNAEPILYPRLKLCRMAQIALARALRLMGMSAPDRMDRLAEMPED